VNDAGYLFLFYINYEGKNEILYSIPYGILYYAILSLTQNRTVCQSQRLSSFL